MSGDLKTTDERGVVALAERILALLDEGAFSSTYKYAVLLALIDLCLEKTSKAGAPPDTIYTAELAEKVVGLYWPHCRRYEPATAGGVLKQNTGNQAGIITAIQRFQRGTGRDPSATLTRAKLEYRVDYDRLVQEVEWILVQMPLPKLQRIGITAAPFLYDIAWDDEVKEGVVRRYQRGEPSDFDNRVRLRPGVGAGLVTLNALIRPLIHRQWAAMVARMNRLEESALEDFLFGAERISLQPLHRPLRELQNNRCFYCGDTLAGPAEVDHFIPWARYPDNRIHNLVLADRHCNNDKRDHLAATDLVRAWHARNAVDAGLTAQIEQIASELGWECDASTTLSVATGIYLGLPDGAQLWAAPETFSPMNRRAVRAALGLAA